MFTPEARPHSAIRTICSQRASAKKSSAVRIAKASSHNSRWHHHHCHNYDIGREEHFHLPMAGPDLFRNGWQDRVNHTDS
ncbi:hypothetical protein MXD63_37780, partial [Frankia sp. Cpl3]|nr:hypothetical protein [Frankia sp. Cpl3]